jgi:hypothetical protein
MISRALAPADVHTSRNSDPASIELRARTFFISTKAAQGKAILQTDRMANLLMDVLRSYTLAGAFRIHEFVVMPLRRS